MKRLIFSVISLATALSFSACDPKVKVRRDKPVPVPKDIEDSHPTTKQNRDSDDAPSVEKKKRDVDPSDPEPVKHNKIPPAPEPKVNNPEYAIKADGKPGYVQSPYDGQHRLIDVRGLPPGTEAECPYTRRTFLVPP